MKSLAIAVENGEAIPIAAVPALDVESFRAAIIAGVRRGQRIAALFGHGQAGPPSTPLDLYAARCSMLHSNSVHSDSTESGTSLPLLYVTNPGSNPLQDYAPATAQEWIVVDLEVLLDRFRSASWEFRRRAMLIPAVRDVVSRRIERWLQFTTEE